MRSDELANAMEARGYNPQGKRTKYRMLKFAPSDLFGFILFTMILTGGILLLVFKTPIIASFYELIALISGLFLMRYLVTVSYNGAAYAGWQKQNDRVSVQGEIERVISTLFNKEISIFASGRTDAKVHALGQTFPF